MSAKDGEVIDKFTIIKNVHGPYDPSGKLRAAELPRHIKEAAGIVSKSPSTSPEASHISKTHQKLERVDLSVSDIFKMKIEIWFIKKQQA